MIDLKNYEKLKNACEYFLDKINLNNNIAYISWLHVVRPHPQNMRDYKNLFIEKKYSLNLFFLFKKKTFIILKFFAKLIKYLLLNKKTFYDSFKYNKKKIDVIFISHLINIDHVGKDDDFYYSKIPNILSENSINSLIVLKNPNNYIEKKCIEKWENSNIPRIILPNSISFFKEISFMVKAFNLSNFLKKNFKYKKNFFFDKIFFQQLLLECYSESTLSSFRLDFQIKKILKKYNPKAIIVTYEGFAWERIVFKSSRSIDKNIHCIGYQHSLINNFYHNIKKNIFNNFDPDSIFTSGLNGFNIINESAKFQIPNLLNIGTHRRLPIALSKKKLIKNVCLVLPEGFLDESYILFKFTLECALKYSEIEFIWRMHPHIEYNVFLSEYPEFKKLPTNIKISNNSLINDLNLCNSAIYRGSTSIISALSEGLIPILLDIKNAFLIDPLANLDNISLKIKNIDSLNDKIINLNLSNDDLKIENIKKKSNFFYQALNKKKLLDFFAKNKLYEDI